MSSLESELIEALNQQLSKPTAFGEAFTTAVNRATFDSLMVVDKFPDIELREQAWQLCRQRPCDGPELYRLLEANALTQKSYEAE